MIMLTYILGGFVVVINRSDDVMNGYTDYKARRYNMFFSQISDSHSRTYPRTEKEYIVLGRIIIIVH